MKNILKILYLIFSLFLLAYVCLPSPAFPLPPKDALQSDEQGDMESPLRRAYFTNLTREEVGEYYKSVFSKSSFLNIPITTYKLNYPPEESQTLIRDQTRSTFLEELVHPLRESIYINGFEPKDPKDAIFIQGKFWRQKIIIRYVPSSLFVRIGVSVLIIIAIPIIFKETKKLIKEFKEK